LFLGHYFSQLKRSNHLVLPSHWRKLISGGVYLTQGFDQNLLILSEDTFHEIYLHITSLNIADPLARLLSRIFLGKASFVEVDRKGIVSLPASLMEYANLTIDFVIVGQGEYLEVWSPGLWHQQQSQINNAQANAQRFSTFTIATR
jgi:MraZ protein